MDDNNQLKPLLVSVAEAARLTDAGEIHHLGSVG